MSSSRLSSRVNSHHIFGLTAILGLVTLLLLVWATVAQAAFHLDYAPGVERTKGIAVQRFTAQAADIGYKGRSASVSVTTAPERAPAPSGDVWGRLRNCESSDGRSSASGRYHGYFQFSQQTWNGVGGSGNPGAASYEEQLKRAKMLQARSGWGPWPSCSRQLGLR